MSKSDIFSFFSTQFILSLTRLCRFSLLISEKQPVVSKSTSVDSTPAIVPPVESGEGATLVIQSQTLERARKSVMCVVFAQLLLAILYTLTGSLFLGGYFLASGIVGMASYRTCKRGFAAAYHVLNSLLMMFFLVLYFFVLFDFVFSGAAFDIIPLICLAMMFLAQATIASISRAFLREVLRLHFTRMALAVNV